MLNDLNFSISLPYASSNPQTIIFRLQYIINLLHNMAATDRLEFSDITASSVY